MLKIEIPIPLNRWTYKHNTLFTQICTQYYPQRSLFMALANHEYSLNKDGSNTHSQIIHSSVSQVDNRMRECASACVSVVMTRDSNVRSRGVFLPGHHLVAQHWRYIIQQGFLLTSSTVLSTIGWQPVRYIKPAGCILCPYLADIPH